MQFHHILSTLLLLWTTTLAAALFQDNGAQQIPLEGNHNIDNSEPLHTITTTMTRTRTRTHFDFDIHTKTMTRGVGPTPISSRKDACDETACAMCAWSYDCEPGTPEW